MTLDQQVSYIDSQLSRNRAEFDACTRRNSKTANRFNDLVTEYDFLTSVHESINALQGMRSVVQLLSPEIQVVNR